MKGTHIRFAMLKERINHSLFQAKAGSYTDFGQTSGYFSVSYLLLRSSILWQATVGLHLCWRLLDIHRKVWLSLLWGHCCFLLGPDAHKILFVPSKSLFPQSY